MSDSFKEKAMKLREEAIGKCIIELGSRATFVGESDLEVLLENQRLIMVALCIILEDMRD